mgnify:CR=1 FL=1
MFSPVPKVFGPLRMMFFCLLVTLGPLAYFDASPGLTFAIGLLITVACVAAGEHKLQSAPHRGRVRQPGATRD